ncbi:peptidoglycan-binding domain-containing protein [Chthonobacter rhizosphaerae]|uniref:peptidoglycan-binding domain-containing protein n=1 Tax=Chthonobacter rhizosphaerae TaxID=2735553 RepID=UPI0015EEA3E2|nr:peptidoglycan-binding protein [Chthonobacter rhizosphaerae]
MAPKGRRRQKADPPRRGMAAAALDTALANPMATLGGAVMVAVGSAIMANALMLQPGAHPAPLFTGTSPLPGTRTLPPPSQGPAVDPEPDPIGSLLGEGPAADPQLVADTQAALVALGFYQGAVDGLSGPMTADAIERFQAAHGLEETGEPSQDLLTILNVAVPRAAAPADGTGPAAGSAPADAAPGPSGALSVPLPRPSPLRSGALSGGDTGFAAAEPQPATVAERQPANVAERPVSVAPVAVAPVAVPPEPGPSPAVEPATPRVRESAARTLRYTPGDGDRPVFRPDTAGDAPVASTALDAPPADPRLARIQTALDDAGYGPLRRDGVWTTETREAIRRFEANRGLAVTGMINEAFLRELIAIGGLSMD